VTDSATGHSFVDLREVSLADGAKVEKGPVVITAL
jgi:hypothetical protein